MYIHSNIDVRSGRLQCVVNGPEMHRWHHAIEIATGVNFATKLAFWDWLFGTAYLPAGKPPGYGLTGPSRPASWRSSSTRSPRPAPAPAETAAERSPSRAA